MATGTPGHFGGGAKGSDKGKYDTATQSFRKAAPAAKSGGKKSGFAGASSSVRPLTPQEHQQAADHLSAGGHHHAAAHHRSAAEQMQTEAPQAGAGEASMENGMYGNKVAGGKPKGKSPNFEN